MPRLGPAPAEVADEHSCQPDRRVPFGSPDRQVVKVSCLLMAGLIGELGEAGPCQIKKRQSRRIKAALSCAHRGDTFRRDGCSSLPASPTLQTPISVAMASVSAGLGAVRCVSTRQGTLRARPTLQTRCTGRIRLAGHKVQRSPISRHEAAKESNLPSAGLRRPTGLKFPLCRPFTLY